MEMEMKMILICAVSLDIMIRNMLL
jgi:hypothetical protein